MRHCWLDCDVSARFVERMAPTFNEFDHAIACPSCGNRDVRSIGWLDSTPAFRCVCGEPFDSSQLIAEARLTNPSLDELFRSAEEPER
jgi:hypothetical protein